MARYKGSDLKGPCFNYESVVSSRLPIFKSKQFSSPLLFCESMPFTIEIPIINAVGPGCDGGSPCWASSQFSGFVEPEGPALSELVTDPVTQGKRIVGKKSPTCAVYAFERYVPALGDGYPVPVGSAIILIRVTQPGGASGYLHMQSGLGDSSAFPSFHPSATFTKLEAVSSKVMWGVIGRADGNCMLMYSDSTLTSALPMIQMFNWGNELYFSRGTTQSSSTGTHAAHHGVTTTSYASIPVSSIVYSGGTMTLVPDLLPEFDANNLETGAANIQWTLNALPMSELSASVYTGTYCEATCGPSGPVLSTAASCSRVQRMFPSTVRPLTCPSPSSNTDTKTQRILAMVSFSVGLAEIICILVVFGLLVNGTKLG